MKSLQALVVRPWVGSTSTILWVLAKRKNYRAIVSRLGRPLGRTTRDASMSCTSTLWHPDPAHFTETGAEVKILLHQATSEIDLSADRVGLSTLAELVVSGTGMMTAEDSFSDVPHQITLTQVHVHATNGQPVLITADASRQILSIAGDPAYLAVLAHNLRGMAEADDGGHLHLDYYPEHPYLAEDSSPLVVNSPHGGMPHR